jgi:hypothetical protein
MFWASNSSASEMTHLYAPNRTNVPILVGEFSRFAKDQTLELSLAPLAPRFMADDMNHYEF